MFTLTKPARRQKTLLALLAVGTLAAVKSNRDPRVPPGPTV